jgi:hypothetical protein
MHVYDQIYGLFVSDSDSRIYEAVWHAETFQILDGNPRESVLHNKGLFSSWETKAWN